MSVVELKIVPAGSQIGLVVGIVLHHDYVLVSVLLYAGHFLDFHHQENCYQLNEQDLARAIWSQYVYAKKTMVVV